MLNKSIFKSNKIKSMSNIKNYILSILIASIYLIHSTCCLATNNFDLSVNQTIVEFSSTNPTQILEDNAATPFQICLDISNPSDLNDTLIEIDFDNASSATEGEDYDFLNYPFQLVFAAGSNSQECFDLSIIDDTVEEGQESLDLFISSVTGGTNAVAGFSSGFTIDFIDNDECANGIQDEDEEGIDCGGSLCPPCTTCTHPDYDALVAFYNSTNGQQWIDNSGWLTNCDVCTWNGVICDDITNRVIRLYLWNNGLSGETPPEIGDLTELLNLVVYNNDIGGTLPVEITNLTKLTYLDYNNNELTGPLPTDLGNMVSLNQISLNYNNISGEIPQSISNLSSLNLLYLRNNELTGSIPDMPNIQTFFAQNNQLSGDLPIQLSTLSNLNNLNLSGNQLTGSIPQEYANLAGMANLLLQNNLLSGCFDPSLSAICGTVSTLDFSGNVDLPNGGDFDAFCSSNVGVCFPVMDDGIYSGDGIVPSNTTATLTDMITFDGDVAITGEMMAASDIRLKYNIRDIENVNELINQLEPKSYQFKQNMGLNFARGQQYGLIAQDVIKILPAMVGEFSIQGQEPFKSINYQALIPILIAGFKDQQSEIQVLKEEIHNLKKLMNSKK